MRVWEKIAKPFWLLTYLAVILFTSGCDAVEGLPESRIFLLPFSNQPSVTPFQPVPWTLTPSPLPATPTPTLPPYSIWIDPSLPEGLVNQVQFPPEIGFSATREEATFLLEIGEEPLVSEWVYALVAPFPTVTDGVSADELHQAWNGRSGGAFKGIPLMVDESTLGMLSAMWGAPKEGGVEVVPAEDLLQLAWDRRPSWAIVPFERLHPKWKVLSIQGISPIQAGFDPAPYPLTIPISLVGQGPFQPTIPGSNRDPEKLTTLVMTGVTALVRATAYTMEQHGVTYPARDLVEILRGADITHISNEVPFAKDCPYPNPVQEGMVFCSDGRYIELLDFVGTDIIELTGDHFSDWGAEAMLYTLELYDQRSWPYYGGGATLAEGRKPRTLSHNGNKIAFIGCNAKGGGYARASASTPGAVTCDFSYMAAEIQRLRSEGYLPVATFQHFEYYTYVPQANQVRDAEILTKAGAVIVSGSQAHQPQGMSFDHEAFVHHGLGNLFFDQLDVSTATRQGFIDRHIFYDGRYISTELLTIWFEDYARARLMTPEEREALLNAVFQASGW